MTSKQLLNSNSLGLLLSLGCVVHCMAMPVLLASLPSWNLTGLTSPLFHQVLAFLGVGIGIWTLVPGWRQHGRNSVLLLAFSGLSIMNYAAFQDEESCCTKTCCKAAAEPAQENSEVQASIQSPLLQLWNTIWMHPTAVGATLLALAHFLNGRCTHNCCGPQRNQPEDQLFDIERG